MHEMQEENKEIEQSSQSTFETEPPLTTANLISFASEIGFSIAIPLAGFVFVGHILDKNTGTSPMFIIVGLLLSLITTSIIILTKIKKFLK